MTQKQQPARRLPAEAALFLIFIIVAAFVAVIVTNLQGINVDDAEPLSAHSYRARVDSLLAIAEPENAEAALNKYVCVACHRTETNIAPSWEGIAERAATRRPPMPADAYIYESIIHPSAYLVEGYADVMLKDIAERITDQELADIIAYLLTPDAH